MLLVSHIKFQCTCPGVQTQGAEQQMHYNKRDPYTTTPICISSVQFVRESIDKSKKRQSVSSTNSSTMAKPALVFPFVANVCKKSSNNSSSVESVTRSKENCSSVNKKSNTSISGLEGFRTRLATEGISSRASELISHSRRGGSISNYESSWRKWSGWCNEREVDPFQCSLKFVLHYLAELFETGYAYRTINVHRSAISAYHTKIEGSPVGQHAQVCALLTGIFNGRPPQPRYNLIWDVEKVLKYLKTLYPLENLSDKLLTLCSLLALTAASRCSEINFLNTEYMIRTESTYVFTFSKLFKSWRKGKNPPSVKFHEYTHDTALCVVAI